MLVSIFIGGASFPQSPDIDPSSDLIPVPMIFNLLEGSISFSTYSKIVTDLPSEYKFLANEVQDRLQHIIKIKLKVDYVDNPAEFKLPRKLQVYPIDEEQRTAFDREGYYLWVDMDGVCLQAPSVRGLFYATRTLFQLILETEDTFWIRRCEIIDYPALEIRGVSDDNARGQVGSIEGLKRCVEEISNYKMNMLQMNLEDMFRSQSHPKSSDEERGCFSHEEIQELVEYAGQHFVDVCPVQSTCGHMENLFFLPEYNFLAEFPHASTCFDISSGETLDYLRDLIQEEIAAWNGCCDFHMACDESYDVGQGRSQEFVEEKGGKGPAYLDYYTRVINLIREVLEKQHGQGNFRIYIYHDIMFKYQEVLEHLPKENLIVDFWQYSSREKYPGLDRIIDADFDFVVTPSSMDWTRFYPSETIAEMNVVNIANYANRHAVNCGKKSHFRGIITASWGDFLNPNLRDERLYNYVLCGDVAWNIDAWHNFTNKGKARSHLPQFRHCFAKQFMGVDPERFKKIQNLLRTVEDQNRLKFRFGPSMAFANLFIHPYQWKPRVKAQDFPRVIADMDKIISDCGELIGAATSNQYFLENLALSAQLMKLYACKILHSKKAMGKPIKKLSPQQIQNLVQGATALREDFLNVKVEYERIWRQSSKEAGLVAISQQFDWMIRFYNEFIVELQNETKKLPDPNLPAEFIYFYQKKILKQPSYFRKNFELAELPQKAYIQCLPFQYAEIFVNGTRVGEVEKRFTLSYMHNVHGIKMFDITRDLHSGTNAIAIKVTSYTGGWPMLNLYGEIYAEEGLHAVVYTDKSWFGSTNPPDHWATCELDVKQWKHVDTFGKPPRAMGALYYPDFEQGLVSHHTKNLGMAAEILPHLPVSLGWFVRFLARVVQRRQFYC